MDFLGYLFLTLVLVFILWFLLFLGLNHFLIRRNRAQLKTLFAQELTFSPINFTQHPGINRGFFDQNTAALLQMDFAPIGDFTIPQLPTENYNRVLYFSPANTYALLSQMRVRGLWSLLTKNLPPWFEFFTTFEDDTSLTTTTNPAAGVVAHSPQAFLQKALWISPKEVFDQHLQTQKQLAAQGKIPQPVSLEGFFVAFAQSFRREGEFRQKYGYLHPGEIQAIARGSSHSREGKIMSWMLGKIDK